VAPPEDIAVSIHLPVLLIFELSICIELSTVNPVIFVLPVQKLWDRTQIEFNAIRIVAFLKWDITINDAVVNRITSCYGHNRRQRYSNPIQLDWDWLA
jgi:hypothetical protein